MPATPTTYFDFLTVPQLHRKEFKMDPGVWFVGFAIGLASVFAVTLMLATILTHDAAEHERRSAGERKK